MPLPLAAFFCEQPQKLELVYGDAGRQRLEALCELLPGCFGGKELKAPKGKLQDVEFAFSTWGMPALSAQDWAAFPKLKAVFYAAGSVQSFARPLLQRGVSVVSAWAANAEPVAELTLAQILLCGKNFFAASARLRKEGPPAWQAPDCFGNYGGEVALLGVGKVGRRVAELLRHFSLKVLAYDPFLSQKEADELGLELVGLEQAFSRGQVISNHLADLPATRGLIRGKHIEMMKQGASFLNTGRGATVDEPGLWQALQRRPDLTALLDVSDPEPPLKDSPAYRLPNVILSPHLAGSLGPEVRRMAALVTDEFEALLSGKALKHAVSLQMLESMA